MRDSSGIFIDRYSSVETVDGLAFATLTPVAYGRVAVTAVAEEFRGAPEIGSSRATIAVLPRNEPAIVAHRGGSAAAPENTMPAFKDAVAAGATFLETDIQRTSDGVWVLMHDGTVLRTTNAASVYPDRANYEVSSFTYEELKALDASGSHPGFAATPIPTLRELLEFIVTQPVKLLIEPKTSGGPTGPSSLITLLSEYPKAVAPGTDDQVQIDSFSPAMLRIYRELAPDLDLGYIYHGITPDFAMAPPVNAFLPYHLTLTAADVSAIHDAGLQLLTWTVEDPARMYELAELGVDGFMTDDPAKAIALFAA